MKFKISLIVIACFIVSNVFSQTNLNQYKYVVVPNKFDFLNEADQYQLNSLSKFLFEKYGFIALKEGGNYPEDINKNRCLALKSNVTKDSGLFKTKLTIELKDCNDRIVYTSEVGESREKEYKMAYNEALRDAFKSIEALNYKYQPSENIISLATTNEAPLKSEVAEEIQELKKKIQILKEEKENKVEAVKAIPVPVKEIEKADVPMKGEKPMEAVVKEALENVLYAQEIENGYQLVDSTPKVVYRIKNTTLKNVFLVEDKNAILYKKGDSWVVEYYDNTILRQKELNIKF